MSRSRVLSSPMAATAAVVAVVLLLAAPACWGAPATDAADKALVGEKQAALYEAADTTGPVGNRKDRQKKQTTTVCIQVAPVQPGGSPAVLCGDRTQIAEEQRRLQQTPVYQVQQPQHGYYGSPHVVQIVPATDTLTVNAPGQPVLQRTQSIVINPGFSSPSDTFSIYANNPFMRSADSGVPASGPAPAAAPAPAASAPAAAPAESAPVSSAPVASAPAAAKTLAPAPPSQAVRDIFANPSNAPAPAAAPKAAPAAAPASAAPAAPADPADPAAAAATAPAAAPAAHQTQARSFGDQEIIVSSQQGGLHRPYGPYSSGTQQVSVIQQQDPYLHRGSQVDIITNSGMGGMGGGFLHSGPPMIGGMNYRAAESADFAPSAPPAPESSQKQQQARTALLQPIVMKKDLVIPAVGAASFGAAAYAPVSLAPVRTQFIAPVSASSGLVNLAAYAAPTAQRQEVGVSGIATIPVGGGATVPVTLNCDLSTLALRGLPQQPQANGAPVPVTAEASARAAHEKQIEDLTNLVKEMRARASQDQSAAAPSLQALAQEADKARAAVEAQTESKTAPSAPPASLQDMTPGQLQDRMRSAGQARYFPDPSPIHSSSVVVGMSPGMQIGRKQTTVISSGGGAGQQNYFPESRPISSSVVLGTSPGMQMGRQQTTVISSSSRNSDMDAGLGMGGMGMGMGMGPVGGFGMGSLNLNGQGFGQQGFGQGINGAGFGVGGPGRLGSMSTFGGFGTGQSGNYGSYREAGPQQPQQAQQSQQSQQSQKPQQAQQSQHEQLAARAAEAEAYMKQIKQAQDALVAQLTSRATAPQQPQPSQPSQQPQQPQQPQESQQTLAARQAEQKANLDRMRKVQAEQLSSGSYGRASQGPSQPLVSQLTSGNTGAPSSVTSQPQGQLDKPRASSEEQIIQPADGAPRSMTQQELLQHLREAEEDLQRARAATLPREEPQQQATTATLSTPTSTSADSFPPTPGYRLLSAREKEAFTNAPRYLSAPL
ncbi:uncharacterized protein LOC113202521 [Frankliniella occidentalis]|uniref:Uncharacterized protein LOC113202521 n=1 Tax=Frankliniella occidentalis TaxID=133901 RepID=A0A6J1RUL6_FRAOC|nr:uncharacterized protein LOC113202521 [Frankliniella occidentalis]